jgi:glycosyltransferase involved in cell wall biosynthesis
MRVGQNPTKVLSSVRKPQRVTVAILNHIPILEGFYSELMNVLDLSLSTARNNAGMGFDLLVFDNASCKQVQDYLLEKYQAGEIQYLILSNQNMGKGGAWNVMLQAAPGEIVAYADNDVLYYENWLAKSVILLEAFPNVGMVTSRPYHSLPELYSSTVNWAGNTPGVKIEKGAFVEEEWIKEFLASLDRSEEEILEDLNIEDIRIIYKDVSAYAGASHWQFLSWKKTLLEFLPIDLSKPMGQVLRLDEMVNKAGYLRLMTDRPYVMNLSNTISNPPLQKRTQNSKQSSMFRKILETPFVKSPLMRLYHLIFKLYSDRK